MDELTADTGLAPRRRAFAVTSDGGDGAIAALEFGPAGKGLDILFLHANGFNAMTYRTILDPLAAERRILAVDMRGHGRTTLPTQGDTQGGGHGWQVFADDLLALLAALGEMPRLLAGHSMGATTLLLAAPRLPAGTVPALVLFDPVVPPRAIFAATGRVEAWDSPMAQAALRRKNEFTRPQAAFAAYRGRGAFQSWPDAVLRDYLADGLVAQPDGTCRLACAPAWEAANFAGYGIVDPYEALDHPRSKIHILRAAQQSTCHFESAATGTSVQVDTVPETTHFLPMERPALIRAALAA